MSKVHFVSTVALAVLALLVTTGARADNIGSVSVNVTNNAGHLVTCETSGPTPVSIGCTGHFGQDGSALAVGSPGSVGAQTFAENGADSSAGSQFSDVLTIAGSGAGFVSFTMKVDGTVGVTSTGYGATPSAEWYIFINGDGPGYSPSSSCLSSLGSCPLPFLAEPYVPNGVSGTFAGAIVGTLITDRFPITLGIPFPFEMELTLADPTAGPGTTSVLDLSHTAAITVVQVFDSNGNLIANPVITDQSGFVYPTSPTLTPEPGSLALLSMGLIGLAGLLVYKRRWGMPA